MVTTEQVREQVELYFGRDWIFHILATGGWNSLTDHDLYSDIVIDGKEIRIYPIKTNREGSIRLAIWDYKFEREPGTNRDDMYISDREDLLNIPVLLDKFFG
jgi:hypothetical protein